MSTESGADPRDLLVEEHSFVFRSQPLERWFRHLSLSPATQDVFWAHWREAHMARRHNTPSLRWRSMLTVSGIADELDINRSTVKLAHKSLEVHKLINRVSPGRDPRNPLYNAPSITEVLIPEAFKVFLTNQPRRKKAKASADKLHYCSADSTDLQLSVSEHPPGHSTKPLLAEAPRPAPSEQGPSGALLPQSQEAPSSPGPQIQASSVQGLKLPPGQAHQIQAPSGRGFLAPCPEPVPGVPSRQSSPRPSPEQAPKEPSRQAPAGSPDLGAPLPTDSLRVEALVQAGQVPEPFTQRALAPVPAKVSEPRPEGGPQRLPLNRVLASLRRPQAGTGSREGDCTGQVQAPAGKALERGPVGPVFKVGEGACDSLASRVSGRERARRVSGLLSQGERVRYGEALKRGDLTFSWDTDSRVTLSDQIWYTRTLLPKPDLYLGKSNVAPQHRVSGTHAVRMTDAHTARLARNAAAWVPAHILPVRVEEIAFSINKGALAGCSVDHGINIALKLLREKRWSRPRELGAWRPGGSSRPSTGAPARPS